jgi:hypothetical protein
MSAQNDTLPDMTKRIRYEVSCDNPQNVERVKIPFAGSEPEDPHEMQWCPGCQAFRRRYDFGAKAATCQRCGRKRRQ